MTSPSTPLGSVYFTSGACAAIGGIYGFLGIPPSPLPITTIALAPVVSVVLWVQNDARHHGLSTVHDFGLLVYLLWPVLVPWYVLKTRGVRAWSLALLLLTAAVAPLVVAVLTAFLHDIAPIGGH